MKRKTLNAWKLSCLTGFDGNSILRRNPMKNSTSNILFSMANLSTNNHLF